MPRRTAPTLPRFRRFDLPPKTNKSEERIETADLLGISSKVKSVRMPDAMKSGLRRSAVCFDDVDTD